MNHGKITNHFFAITDPTLTSAILQNIASHYGISEDEARAEVTDDDAESLLDYISDDTLRSSAQAWFKRVFKLN